MEYPLLTFTQILTQTGEINDGITLSFEQRQKSRQRVQLDSGTSAGLMLPRGTLLRGGDLLQADTGFIAKVYAANEPVTTAHANNFQLLARGAYHLGNRHVALQVGETWLRYLADHVLDEMVVSLGLNVKHEHAPFEPEAGAYHDHHHAHV